MYIECVPSSDSPLGIPLRKAFDLLDSTRTQ